MSYDVAVQRGVEDFGSAVGADTNDVAITTVGNVEDAFPFLHNSQNSASGLTTADAVTKNPDDMSMGCLLQDASTVRLNRLATGEDADYKGHWGLWEYIGDPGGPNEFIVREQRLQLVTGGVASLNRDISALTNAVDDFTKLVPVVTGYVNENTATTGFNLRPTLRIDVGAEELIFERTATTTRIGIYYALVEFTGSNWQVEQNVSHTYTAAGTDETETISTISAWDTAFIFASHHTDQANLDEIGWTVRPGSTVTTVRFRMRSGATIATDERTIAFVVRNPTIAVTHDDSITGSQAELASGATGQSYTITAISNPITAADALCSVDCAGTGNAHPRAHWGWALGSTTLVEFRRGRSGQVGDAVIQVIEFSQRVVETTSFAPSAGAATVAFDADHICDVPAGAARFEGAAVGSQHLFSAHRAALSLDVESVLGVAVRIKDTGVDSVIFKKTNVAGTAFEYELVYLEAIPGFRFTARDNTDSTNVSVVSSVEPVTNRWYVILCFVSETAFGGSVGIQLFSVEERGLDEIAQFTVKGGFTIAPIVTADFYVGWDPVAAGDPADADIQQVRRWNALLVGVTLTAYVNLGRGRTHAELEEFGVAAGAAWSNLVFSFELNEVDANASRGLARKDSHTSGLELVEGGSLDLVGSVSGHRTSVLAARSVSIFTGEKVIQCGQLGVNFTQAGTGHIFDSTPLATAWDIDSATGHTFEIWFRVDVFEFGVGNFAPLFTRWKTLLTPNTKYRLNLFESGELQFTVAAPTQRNVSITPGLVAGRIYQVICELDFLNNEIRILLSSVEDGYNFASATTSGAVAPQTTGPSLRLGSDEDVSGTEFDGMMCRFRKWSLIFSNPNKTILWNGGKGWSYNNLPSPMDKPEGSFEMGEYSSGVVEVRRIDSTNVAEADALRDTNTFPSREGVGCPIFADSAVVTIDADHVVQLGQVAADFPGGANDDLTTDANAALDIGSATGHTFEVWFFLDSVAETRIFSRYTLLAGQDRYYLRVEPNGQVVWSVTGAVGLINVKYSEKVQSGRWYQAICDVDFTANQASLRISSGCGPIGPRETVTIGSLTPNAGGPTLIWGRNPNVPNSGLDGAVCRWRKWDGVLGSDPAASTALFYGGKGRMYADLPSPWGAGDGNLEAAFEMVEKKNAVARLDFFGGLLTSAARASRTGVGGATCADTALVTTISDKIVTARQLCARFGGSGSRLVSDGPTWDLANDGAFEVWIRITGTTDASIIEKWNHLDITDSAFRLRLDTGDLVLDYVDNGAGSTLVIGDVGTPESGATLGIVGIWAQVVLLWNHGASSSVNAVLSYGGIPRRNVVSFATVALTGGLTSVQNFNIGYSGETAAVFDGDVQMLRRFGGVFDALGGSFPEIDDLYDCGRGVWQYAEVPSPWVDVLSRQTELAEFSDGTHTVIRRTSLNATVYAPLDDFTDAAAFTPSASGTGCVVCADSPTSAIDAQKIVQTTSFAVAADAATTANDADEIKQTTTAVQADAATTAIDAQLRMNVDVAVSADAATALFDAQKVIQSGATDVQASTAFVTIDASEIKHTTMAVVAGTAFVTIDASYVRVAAAVTVQAGDATAIATGQKVIQTTMTAQAGVAVVAFDTQSVYGVTMATVAGAATTAIDAQKIHQVSVAVSTGTAFVTISADEIKHTTMAVSMGVAVVAIDADEIKQTTMAVEADLATADSPVRILVIPANEELVLAREVFRKLS